MKKRILWLLLGLTAVLTMGSSALAAEDTKAAMLADGSDAFLMTVESPSESSPSSSSSQKTAAAPAAQTPAPSHQSETAAVPDGPTYLVDGRAVADQGLMISGNTTYVSVMEFVTALRADAAVSWEEGQAVVRAAGLYLTARPGDRFIAANGRYLYVPEGVVSGAAGVQVPVRALAQALDAAVDWDSASGRVSIHSGSGAILSGEQFYNEQDLYWLSRIINAESGNQPLEGKLAVGTVILNRVRSPMFPGTIYDVIFDGRQFSPVANGSIHREPNAESVLAAKLCLEGARVAENSLYFVNPSLSPNSWAQQNRPYITTIGAHSFYA